MSNYKLDAKKRLDKGSNASKKLRRENMVPAEVYQRGEDNISVTVTAKELERVINEAGTTSIIQLNIDGEERNVLIKDYQVHPYKNMYLHVDFQGVRMDETIKVLVPIVLLNRNNIHVQPSVLTQPIDEIEVESLPGNIPQQAQVDVEDMQYDDAFYVKDLDIFGQENIEILNDPDELVCLLSEPEEEDLDEEVEEVDAADVEVIGEDEEDEEVEEEGAEEEEE